MTPHGCDFEVLVQSGSSSSPDRRRLLPEGYYVENFLRVLAEVRGRDADLLGAEEVGFAEAFGGLTEGAQRLYVRLLSRRGPLFRVDLLGYSEIPRMEEAAAELVAAGLADDAPEVAVEGLLGLLRRGELAGLASELGLRLAGTVRKGEMVEACAGERVGREFRRRFGVVRLLRTEVVLVYRLLFFGNLRQDFSEFVLLDLGVVRYEAYSLDRELRLFPSRDALEDALAIRGVEGLVEDLLGRGDLEAVLRLAEGAAEDGWHETARRRVDRVLNRVARELERAGREEDALRLYAAATLPPARERRARVLAKLGLEAAALELAEEIAGDPRDESEAVFAPRFAHRLRRRRGEPLRGPRRVARPTRELLLTRDARRTIEAQVVDFLEAEGRQAFFAENWLWRTLFGLAFWDVVFAPVVGAFQHPFQSAPLDLRTAEFRRARQELIDRRLEELRADASPGAALLELWEAKQGTASSLVSWGEVVRPGLELALARLDGARLAWVADRMSRDMRRYDRGFPDLFVAREEAPGFELWEVKGPGDQLRPEQSGWIDHLNAGGLPTWIVRVRWRRDVD